MYEFNKDSDLVLRTISSSGVMVTANIQVLYDNGQFGNIPLQVETASNRTVLSDTSNKLPQSGKVVGVFVFAPGSTLKRGQTYVSVRLGQPTDLRYTPLCSGYVQAERPLGLGVFEESLNGKGFLHTTTIASDVAGNVDTTFTPAVTNAQRILYGIVWYYHASSDVDSRVMAIEMRRPWGALPTGGTAGTIDKIFDITGPTLTANEEGSWFLYNPGRGDGYFTTNDNGSLSTNSTATVPIPFPFKISGGDPLSILLSLTDGHANDRYSAYGLVEEWLEP